MKPLYDAIGLNYTDLRKPDTRIARLIDTALGDAKTVLNIGAGTGSYEPVERQVIALEPSTAMIAQRQTSSATVIQAVAENLPFADNSFDAAMAVLTVHHWTHQARGMQEMRRVTSGKLVFLTFDPDFDWFWLADYFPELVTLDKGQMPSISSFKRRLGSVKVTPVPIPHDCQDGFLAAYWRRPAAYLDARTRAVISPFRMIDGVDEGLEKLERDLTTGVWQERYGHLMDLDELDCGYRLVEKI